MQGHVNVEGAKKSRQNRQRRPNTGDQVGFSPGTQIKEHGYGSDRIHGNVFFVPQLIIHACLMEKQMH